MSQSEVLQKENSQIHNLLAKKLVEVSEATKAGRAK
jgi:hypothetical protein